MMRLREVSVWQVGDYPNQVIWGKKNEYIAIALANGEVKIAYLGNNSVQSLEAHQLGCLKIALDQSQKLLASAGQDNLLRIWDTATWQVLHSLQLSKQWINDIAWSPETNYLAVTSGKILHIYNTQMHLLYSLTDFDYSPSHVAWLNESNLIIAKYGGLTRLNLSQEPAIEEYPFPTALTSLHISPNEQYIAGGTQDNAVHFWQLPYMPQSDLAMSGYPHKVKSLSWQADSSHLATHSQNKVVLWKVAQKGGPAGSKPIVLHDHVGKVTKVAYAPSDNKLWGGDSLGMICLFEPAKKTTAVLKDFLGSGIVDITWATNSLFAVATEQGQVGCYEIMP